MWAWEKQKKIGDIGILSGGGGGYSTHEDAPAFTFQFPMGEGLGLGFSDSHSEIPQCLPDNSQNKKRGFLFLEKSTWKKLFYFLFRVVIFAACHPTWGK